MADASPSSPATPATPTTASVPSTGAAGAIVRAAPRALLTLSPAPRRGEPFEVRALIAHPMETGHRADALGNRVPRDILRRVEARLDGELVFAADLHPAVSANPYIVFPLVVQGDGTIVVSWVGDRGFAHSVSMAFKVA